MAKGKVDKAGEIITDTKMGYFVDSTTQFVPGRDDEGNPTGSDVERYTGFNIVTSGVTGGTVAGNIFAGTVNSVTVSDTLNVYGGGTYIEQNTIFDQTTGSAIANTESVYSSNFNALVTDVTVNGGTLNIMSGVTTADDEVLSAGAVTNIILQDGTVNVSSGALASNATLSGGVMSVGAGGSATNATLNGGVMDVGAGGSATNVEIKTNGGHLTGDGVITNVTMNRALSGGMGNYTYASAFDFIHINRNTSAILNFSGGMITSGAYLHLIGLATVGGGANSNDKLHYAIVSGGTLNVQNNGIVEGIGVSAIQTGASSWESGTLHVQSGTASNVSVGSHAVLDVDFNVNGITFAAVADNVTISSGGTLTGLGRATNVTMQSGAMAEFQVSANQVGANSRYESTSSSYLMTHIGSNQGTLNVLGGYVIGSANDLHFSGTLHAIHLVLSSGGSTYDLSSGVVTDTTVDAVSSGGSARLVIASGGTGTKVTAQSYGVLQVSSGGYINGATVSANALVDIHVGGSAGTVIVDNGGNYRVIIGQGTVIADLTSNGSNVLTSVTSALSSRFQITGAGNVIGVGYGGTAVDVTVGDGATLEVNGKDGLNEHYIAGNDSTSGGTVTGNITISSGGSVSGSWIRHAQYKNEQVSGSSVSLLDYYQMASAGFTNVGTTDIVISANSGTPAMSAGQVTGIISGGTSGDIGTAAISGTMYVAPGGEISNIRYSAGTIVLRDESPSLKGTNELDSFTSVTSATNITLDYSTEGTGATMLVDRGAVLNGGRINYFDPSAIGTPFHQFLTATIRVNGYASDIDVYNNGRLVVTNSYVPSGYDPAYLTADWSAQLINGQFYAVYNAVYNKEGQVPEYSAWTSSLTFGDFDTAGNMKFAVVSGVTVYSAGVLTAMDDTFVLGAVLSSGGSGTVLSGAWMSGATIFNEGRLSVQAGGSAYDIDVSAGQGAGLGGHLNVDGNVTSTILRGLGADMYVNDGGVATSNLVHSEARIIVNSGGQLVDTLISGGSRQDPENPSAHIYFGGGTVNLNGGSATSTWIYEGGVLNMRASGAYASETTLSAGGEMNVAEGIAEVIHLSAGGTLNLYDQGTTISALVNDDAVFNVNNTGLAQNTVIFSGGTAIASANTGRGGMTGVAVSGGGLLILSSGGRADNVDIARDESYFTNSTMESRGGTLLFADPTGVANDINLSMGGLVRYQYDGKWHEFYNAYRQSTFVTIDRLSGGVLTGNMHQATLAGDIYVGNGGVASAITIENGGYVTILNGGSAVSTTLNVLSAGQSGGITGSAGATLVAVNLESGNSMTMMNGVNATGIVISAGGLYNFVVDDNTTLEGYYIHSNGGEVRFNIVSGQNRQWPGGENGSAVTVSEGGRYLLLNGANFNNVAISSGGIIDMEDGRVTLATIASGGHLNLSGGFASNVTAENGASLRVSGGVLSQAFVNNAGTTFEVGGYLSNIDTLVYGTVRDVTVSSGGVVNVTNGGQIIDAKLVASNTVMNVSGGSALNMTLSSGTINVVSGTSTFDAYFADNGTTVTSAFYTEAFYNQVATAAGTGPVYVITTDPATGGSTTDEYANLDTFHRNTYCSSIETAAAAGGGTVSYTPAGGDAIVYSSMEAFYDSSYYEIIEDVAGVNGVSYDDGAGTAETYTSLADLISSKTTLGTDDVAILSALLDSTGATLKIGETIFRDFDSFDSFTYLESILNNGTISAGGSTFGSVDEFDSVGHLSATLGSANVSISAGGVTYTGQAASSSYVGYVSSMTLNGGVTLSAGIGAVMNVISGTSNATDAIVNISGGSATALDFVAGTVHVSGTAGNSGYVSSAVIQSAAHFNVGDYGYAEDVKVVSGGSALVSGGIGSNVTIDDQGTLTLQATGSVGSSATEYTGSINDLNVLSGGFVSATANASVTDADVAGTLNINSASATDVLVSGTGALLDVAGDADVTSLTVTGSSATAVLSAGTFTSVTVDDTAVINISSGSMTSAWINSAGIMTMTSGALSSVFVDNGTLNISGGQANELQLDGADGVLNVSGTDGMATQVASVTILNGSANIQTSASVSGVTVSNGILNISGAAAIVSGGAVNGGTVNVDENGLLTGVDTTDHLGVAGGEINVNNGGSAALLNVSGTAAVGEETSAVSAVLNVNAGGSVSETVITGEGVMYVSGADAIANVISIENGGSAAVQSAGKITSARITSAALDVFAGGTAADVEVSEDAVMNVDGANASATEVLVASNGTLNVSAHAAVTSATVSGALVTTPGDPATSAIHSAVMNVYADGTANSVTVNEYGYLNNEGTVTGVTLNSAATLAGSGIANDLTLNSGAYVDNTLGSGFMVLNTSSATLGQMSSGVIQGSNTGLVFSGDAILGGTASGFVVSGGAFTVLNGATANDTEVSATAQMIVSGTASGGTVFAGGTQTIAAGGSAQNVTVAGVQSAAEGATANLTTVQSGGLVTGEGALTDIRLESGGQVQAGDADPYAHVGSNSAFLAKVSSGVILGSGNTGLVVSGGHVMLGGEASGFILTDADISLLDGNTIASATTMTNGVMIVSAGASALDGTITGGSQLIRAEVEAISAGYVSGYTISNGYLENAGLAERMTLVGGSGINSGTLNDAEISGTIFSNTAIANDVALYANAQFINSGSGAVVSGITGSNGAVAKVYTGGSAYELSLGAAGSAFVSGVGNVDEDGQPLAPTRGYVSSAVVDGDAAKLNVQAYGLAENVAVRKGTVNVFGTDAVLSNVAVSGGLVSAYQNGYVSQAAVSGGVLNITGATGFALTANGGEIQVFAGGVANEIDLDSGTVNVSGTQNGAANVTDLDITGGTAVISSFASATDVDVEDGTMNVAGGIAKDVIQSGGLVDVTGTGYISAATITAGALKITNASGTALDLSGTAEVNVNAGGSANLIDVADGTLNVSAGEVEDVVQSGGVVNVIDNGTLTSGWMTDGTMNVSGASAYQMEINGGELNIQSAGYVSAAIVADGTVNVSGGAAVFEDVEQNGGTVNVDAEGYVSAAAIMAGKLNITNASGTALDLSGTAEVNVNAGGSANLIDVADGILNVSAGAVEDVIQSGGEVNVSDTGYISAAAITAGALNITNASGTALDLSGTAEVNVNAGGFANLIDVADGILNVSAGAVEDVVQSGGVVKVIDGGSLTDGTLTSGTMIVSSASAYQMEVNGADAVLNIQSAGYVSAATLNLGTVNVSGGAAIFEDVIQSGGIVNVTETGYVSAAVITAGELNITNASGTALDLSGTAEVNVNAGGSANLIDVAAGTLNVTDGGIAEDVTQSGGEVDVTATGYVSSAVITAGALNITNASGTELDLSGTAEVNVNAGGSANLIDVAGGTMNVISGIVEDVVQSGGEVNVSDTGYITDAAITGGELNIRNASGTELNISGDAVANILANGSANMIGISGGALNVSSGIAENVMQSGGVVTARDGGYISAATVAAGDMVFDYNAIGHDINISGGNVSANMSDLTQVNIGAGYLFATNDATVSGMTQSGGSAMIGYEAVLSTVAITDGRLTVSGGDAYDVTMNDNAVVEGFTGSFCGVNLNNGLLNVSGGLVSGMVQAGGEANMDAGVVLSASIVRDGELNLSAAVAWDLNVSGGTVNGTAGASSYRMNVSGGTVNMTDGAYISATTQVGGEINVENNAVASSVAVSDGVINITDGGSIREIELSGAGQAFVKNATAVDADITGGSMFVNVSGSLTSGVISNDGILAISGTGATGTELDLVDGTLTVEDAAYISAVRQSGGVATVDNATAEDVLLTGGSMDVVSAATITSATVQNGSLNIMSATGTDLVLDELAGATAAINVQTEGTVTNVTLTSGYLNVSGTAAEVTSVTMTNGIMNVFDAGRVNEVAFDGGTVNISGTSALISGMVQTDGVVYVQSAGTLQRLTMSEGTVNVSGVGALATDVVMDGGEMEVIASGTVSGMLMNNDTTLNVSGGFGNDLDINGASAEVNVSDNGYISTVRLSAGTVNVATGSGADIDLYDGTLNISAGGIVEDIRQSGGLLDVKADGLASNVVMSENTTMYVAGNAVDGTIGSGAVQYITSGGAAEGFTVFGTQMISAGATASDTTAESGGLIDNEGTLTKAEIKSGAVLEMAADAIATDVALHSGGMIADSFTHMGNTAVNLGQLSGTMIAGAVDGLILSGTVETTSGADLTNTELGSGTMTMFGGTADTVKVSSHTTLTVNDTAAANNVTVLNHGTFDINEGGTAATAMLSSGAVMNVSGANAIASAVNVYYGAELNVLSAGVVDGAVLSGRMSVTTQGSEIISRIHSAVMTVEAGANGSNVTLDAYGYLINEGTVDGAIVKNKGVLSGDGTAYDVTISSGGEAIGYIHGGSESVLIEKIYDGYIAGEVSGTLMISGGLSIGSGADVFSPEILNGGTLHVLSSAVASSAVLSNGGAVNISNGGLVVDVDGEGVVNILSGGTLSGAFLWNEGAANVSNGGIGYDITLGAETGNQYGGQLLVLSGGRVSGTIVNSAAYMYVSAYGAAFATTVTNGGRLFVYTNGTADDTIISSGAEMHLEGAASGLTVNEAGLVIVSHGATVGDFMISSGGIVNVANGATVMSGEIKGGGTMTLLDGAILNGTITVDGSITDGDGLSSLVIAGTVTSGEDGACVNINISGNKPSAISQQYAISNISGLDAANIAVTVDPDEQLFGTYVIARGSAASNATYSVCLDGVYYTLDPMTSGMSTVIAEGAYYDRLYKFEIVNSNLCVTITDEDDSIRNYVLYEGENLKLGAANEFTHVGSDGTTSATFERITSNGLYGVASGLVASSYDETTGSRGLITMAGTSYDFVLEYADMVLVPDYAYSNPNLFFPDIIVPSHAYNTIVRNGTLQVNANTSAVGGSIETENGIVSIQGSGYLEGFDVAAGSMFVESDGVAADLTISGSGTLFNSGRVSNVTVGEGGVVSQGRTDAVLSAIELNTNGTIDTFTQVGTDAATIEEMSGNAITGNASGLEYVGDLTVTKGGTLTDTIVSSGTLAMTNSATASATTVLGGGVMSLNYRATATGTTLEDGAILDVNVNGSALETVVQSGAVMNVNSSGYAKDVDLTDGGTLVISGQQATVTGTVELGSAGHMIASGTVAVDSATLINIDISADAPVADEESEHDYRVDNFNALTAATITVTVDANQELGAYILGTGAAEFAGTLTVRTNDDAFTGELSFSVNNGQLENGNIVYNLYTDTYGRLYIKVAEYTVENDTTPPVAPIAAADVVAATNGNVIVSATFSDDTAVAEYSLDGSTWNTYTEGILFEANGTVCFRAIDAAGNVSDVTEFAVTNIDKIAPEAPVASADITEATQQNVIVSATFSDDTAVMEYSLDGDTWQAYTAGVEFSDNGTIYFRATDAVGNVSAMTRYDVTNIDRVAPDAPVAAADITEATNGNVTVTATVNETGAVLEYSLDGGTTWNVYTDGIVMEENGTVSFRATDAAGNISDVTSLEVSNIDKIAPEAPTAAADITEMTTGDVTVSATFSNDSVTTEYSLDGETWVAYPDGGIIMSVNGTVYFRGIDAAGNISDVVSYEVTNITVAGPEAPVVSADITEPTNTDVVVSAVFGSDVTSKQYSLDGKNWKAYPANGVVMEENGTVYFRGVNADGVYSDVVSYEVTNIDKVAPEQPVVIADITDATNKNVTVSATFSDDSAKTEYSLDGETWTAYPDGGVVMEENGTVYFRGIDAAGNISDVTSIEVANIDKEAPQQPVASANITSETTGTVTVSAVFSNDTALKEYSLDGTTWQIYTTGIVFEENGFVYFRATDAVGNVSEVTSFEVSNIIVIGPEKPVVSADITTPTNGNVTVSATFGSDTVTQQYSLDGTTWQIYTAGIVFEENGLIYFRGLNEEGNPSDVVSYEVSNIDKVAPVKPVASADITKTTNKNVIVSAQYSADTVTQQYSLDGTTWQAYTTGIVFAENGAVYFRSIDAAGNISEVTNYEVTNIDKIAPVAPSASADITQDTNESVTIYATFSADSAVKEFSYDGKVWHDYTKYNGITMTQNGTVYFRGVDEAGNVSDVVSYEVTNIVTGPDAPNGINTEVNEYKVTYTWNKLELEKGQKAVYTVIINGEEYDTKSNKLKLSKQAPGTYTYQVMATVSQKGMPSYETLVSESQTITVYDVTAPKKGKIEIGEITKDSVTINLTKFSDNVGIVDYEVFLDGVSLGRTNGATSFTYEKMDVAGKLTFSAVAYDEAGLVSKVAKKNVTVEDITAPTAVTNVTVVGEADEDLVELTWDASTDNVGVVKYEVLINGKTYTTKTNSISIKKLDAGTFDVEVVAIDKAKNESAAGTCEVTVKDITAPKAVSVKAKVENNDVTFTWKASTDNVGVEGYIMKYGVAGTDSRFWTNEFEFGASDTMFEIEGLDMGSYAYEMVAFDAAGNESKVKSGKFNVKTALMSEDLMPAGNIDLMSWQDGYTDAAFSAAVDSMLDDKDKLLASDTMQLA